MTSSRRELLRLGAMSAVSWCASVANAAGALREHGLKGTLAPDWQLQDLDGERRRLSDLGDKAVVLNFWATWCAPCRVESRWLGEIYNKYRPRGVEVVGISMDEPADDATVAQFVKSFGITYQILLRGQSIAADYGGVRVLPQTFFVDRSRMIVRNTLGIKNREELYAEVARLAARP